MIRISPRFLRSLGCKLINRGITAASNPPVNEVNQTEPDATDVKSDSLAHHSNLSRSRLISDAFKSLSVESQKELDIALASKVEEAKSVDELLNIGASLGATRKVALRVLFTLGDWTNDKKINLSDFEKDPRFVDMCRSLVQKETKSTSDLNAVLGVTGDDEAAKLISNATLSQMIRILTKLSTDKKRSPPVLRALAFNISKSEEKMSIKQCADVLFAMTSLSFYDEVLMVKTCSDAATSLTTTGRSAVVGSIARSLGMLRFRDIALLDQICKWMSINKAMVRPQDAVAVLMALAIVDHQPADAESFWKVALPMLRPPDLPNFGLYLDAVWSLLLLDRATHEHVGCVLSSPFIEKLRNEDGGQLTTSTKLRLLNISAGATSLMKNYKGPQIDAKEYSEGISFQRTKDKTALINCVMETLSNLLPGDVFLRRDVPTYAGFVIDSECAVDKNCTPLPINRPTPPNAVKVAILVLGYHDTCVGARFRPNGVQAYAKRILEARNYRVLTVLHSDFSPSSKLVQRVQYLEKQLKSLVNA